MAKKGGMMGDLLKRQAARAPAAKPAATAFAGRGQPDPQRQQADESDGPTIPRSTPPEVGADEGPTIPRSTPPEVGADEGPTIPRSTPPEVGADEGPTIPRSTPPEVGADEGPTIPRESAQAPFVLLAAQVDGEGQHPPPQAPSPPRVKRKSLPRAKPKPKRAPPPPAYARAETVPRQRRGDPAPGTASDKDDDSEPLSALLHTVQRPSAGNEGPPIPQDSELFSFADNPAGSLFSSSPITDPDLSAQPEKSDPGLADGGGPIGWDVRSDAIAPSTPPPPPAKPVDVNNIPPAAQMPVINGVTGPAQPAGQALATAQPTTEEPGKIRTLLSAVFSGLWNGLKKVGEVVRDNPGQILIAAAGITAGAFCWTMDWINDILPKWENGAVGVCFAAAGVGVALLLAKVKNEAEVQPQPPAPQPPQAGPQQPPATLQDGNNQGES